MKRSVWRGSNEVKKESNRATSFMDLIQDVLKDEPNPVAVSFIKHEDGSVSAVTIGGSAAELIGVTEVGKSIIQRDRFGADE